MKLSHIHTSLNRIRLCFLSNDSNLGSSISVAVKIILRKSKEISQIILHCHLFIPPPKNSKQRRVVVVVDETLRLPTTTATK